MAPGSPAGSAPGSPRLEGPSRGASPAGHRPGSAAGRLEGPSRGASPAGHRPGSAAGPTRLPLDRAFPRSARGAVKIARTMVALAAFIRFLTAGEQLFYAAYAGLDTVIIVFFLLLYLLRLDARMRWLPWPLADIFMSGTSVMFLIPVGLTAVKIKTNKWIMDGGVLSLILLALCLVDIFLLSEKISLEKARERSAAS
ncbi:chemokine-like factor isoform X1 [Prinia subflava]|uniref:chemokine-like factor isoform X1 n=1 Tax=Prinia subflava TaxID=208062 RepID=UPI002FE3AEEB